MNLDIMSSVRVAGSRSELSNTYKTSITLWGEYGMARVKAHNDASHTEVDSRGQEGGTHSQADDLHVKWIPLELVIMGPDTSGIPHDFECQASEDGGGIEMRSALEDDDACPWEQQHDETEHKGHVGMVV